MSKKKEAAGSGHSTAAKKKSSKAIIAEPIDIVNMSEAEIIQAAIDRLQKEDKAAKFDRYGQVMHHAVVDALCVFCRQSVEFSQAICQTDKTIEDCMKAVSKGIKSSISDLEAYTRAVQFYFTCAAISFRILIDVGDGVLCDRTPEPAEKPQHIVIGLDSLLDW